MMKLAPIAVVLVAAAGAWAQSACCSEKKSEVVVQTVSTEKVTCCASEQGVNVQTVSQEAATCEQVCEMTCIESGVAVQTVANTTSCDGCDEPCTEACEKACEEACEDGVQTVAFPTDMPKMIFVVGAKETCCPVEAGELAGETQTVAYKVGESKYACQAEAGKAYAAALHNYVDNFTRVSFVVDGQCTSCPFEANSITEKTGKTMQYKVGNTTFDCADKAIRAAALAHYQVQQVKLGHAVNGEATSCNESFAAAKACSETKATYLVGAKQTECEIEASCLLEMARVEAAIAACQMVASQG